MGEQSKIHICFVSHAAYGAMTGGINGHIGGVERQTKLLADHFHNVGFQVSVVTWGYQNPSVRQEGGIDLIQLCREDAGIPILRFLHPRWTSLNRALRQANADVYYHNCAEAQTGQIAMWCKRMRRRFIYSVASDPEVMSGFPDVPTRRSRWLFGYGLRNADAIIVQKKWQHDQLEKNFGLASTMLPMPADSVTTKPHDNEARNTINELRVCWVGRIAPVKRPDLFLKIASALPNIHFQLVGPVGSSDSYSRSIMNDAAALPNVEVKGRVNLSEIGDIYRQSQLLLCTSDFEGFPNTFLEAWAYGLPVVSTVDPDNLLSTENIGVQFETVDQGVGILRNLAEDTDRIRSMGDRARRYFLKHHDSSIALDKFSDYVRHVVKNRTFQESRIAGS